MKLEEEERSPFQNISFPTVVSSQDKSFVFFGKPQFAYASCSTIPESGNDHSSQGDTCDVHMLDHESNKWLVVPSKMKEDSASQIPSTLCLAAGCYVERIGAVFLFGGIIRNNNRDYLSNCTNTLFEWKLLQKDENEEKSVKSESECSLFKPAAIGTNNHLEGPVEGEFRALPSRGLPPKEAYGASLNYHKQNHALICYGGCRGSDVTEITEVFGDVYEYDLFTMNWKLIRTTGRRPSLCFHTSNLIDNKLYILGGLEGNTNELVNLSWRKNKSNKRLKKKKNRMMLHILNLKNLRWIEVCPRAPPNARFGHASFPVLSQSSQQSGGTRDGRPEPNINHLIVLFGINNESRKVEKSTYIYNLKNNRWKVMNIQIISNKKKRKKNNKVCFKNKSLLGSSVVFNSIHNEFTLFGGEISGDDENISKKQQQNKSSSSHNNNKFTKIKKKKKRNKNGFFSFGRSKKSNNNNNNSSKNMMKIMDEEEDCSSEDCSKEFSKEHSIINQNIAEEHEDEYDDVVMSSTSTISYEPVHNYYTLKFSDKETKNLRLISPTEYIEHVIYTKNRNQKLFDDDDEEEERVIDNIDHTEQNRKIIEQVEQEEEQKKKKNEKKKYQVEIITEEEEEEEGGDCQQQQQQNHEEELSSSSDEEGSSDDEDDESSSSGSSSSEEESSSDDDDDDDSSDDDED